MKRFYWRMMIALFCLSISNAFSFGERTIESNLRAVISICKRSHTLFQMVISVWYSLGENYFVRILRRYLFPSSPSIRNPLCAGTTYRTEKNCSFFSSIFSSVFICSLRHLFGWKQSGNLFSTRSWYFFYTFV